MHNHLNLQILEMICPVQLWALLLGCGLDMKRSGAGVPGAASWVAAKILEEGGGGDYFNRPSLSIYYHI